MEEVSFWFCMEEILNILMKKLASVAEEGVRVEEDAGCHAARRPGAGARPGSFLMFVHSIFYICS